MIWMFSPDPIPTKINNPIPVFQFITPILKSLVVPVIWLALIDAIYSRIAPFFALNRIFFPANEEKKQNNQSDFKACLK